MKLQPHPHRPAVRTASGNGEERAAQIERIQGRLDRLRRFAAEITTEVADMARDIENLSAYEPPTRTPPSAKRFQLGELCRGPGGQDTSILFSMNG